MKTFAFTLLFCLVAAAASAQVQPVLNEFVFNHTGVDDHEFIEIFGQPLTDFSAYSILAIEGDGTGAGVVDDVYTVGSTDAAGFWTTGFLTSELENGSQTLLLVLNFSGSQGNDLDTDDDGVLDSTPWDTVRDDVAVWDGGVSDRTYAGVVLNPSFDGGAFTVGGASRIPNGFDSDAIGDWVRNDFDGAGLPGFGGTFDLNEAMNTPGDVNSVLIPEPASLGLIGLAALLFVRRKRA